MQIQHNKHPCWAARSVAPRYIFHTGKSRWAVSKQLDDGSRCWAYVQDPGNTQDPSQCPGPWQCVDDTGNWGPDGQVTCSAVAPTDDKFVQLRMSLDGEMRQYGLIELDSLKSLWKRLDFNGNNIVSLAEIDKMVKDMTQSGTWPQYLDSKPALMRAYKKTTLKDGDGDEWIQKKEFHALLLNLFWFGKLFQIFAEVDTSGDRRIDFPEFQAALSKLGLDLDESQAKEEFAKIDTNGGGQILFVEFCAYVRQRVNPDADPNFDGDIISGEQCGKNMRKKHGNAATRDLIVVRKRGSDFDALEKKFKTYMKEHKKLKQMWNSLDYNGNNQVSLAEIDKWVVENYPLLNHKPALMMAYKKAARENNGDDFVQKKEFKALLGSLIYFNKVFWLFNEIDGDDRRITFPEFQRCLVVTGTVMTKAEAQKEFEKIDQNQGGYILFEEFCQWFTMHKCPESVRGTIS